MEVTLIVWSMRICWFGIRGKINSRLPVRVQRLDVGSVVIFDLRLVAQCDFYADFPCFYMGWLLCSMGPGYLVSIVQYLEDIKIKPLYECYHPITTKITISLNLLLLPVYLYSFNKKVIRY